MRTVVLIGLIILLSCGHDINSKMNTIKILDNLPSSDHLRMQMTLAIDFNNVIDFTVDSRSETK